MATAIPLTNSAAHDNLQRISQIRLQLSTRNADISLPENPGPILVNTSNVNQASTLLLVLINVQIFVAMLSLL